MIDEKTVKDIISVEIAGFLIKTDPLPKEIEINVRYPGSLARITIDYDKLVALSPSCSEIPNSSKR